MELVCFQGRDKENWPQINALIKRGEWERVLVIKDKKTESFLLNKNCSLIEIDAEKSLLDLKNEILTKLKPLLGKDFEIALSLASGNGKENMALISALLNVPLGIRLAAYTKNGIEFLS